ncbi:MAG: TldD/PmbA family protein, partial [Acidobacteriota bacterium]
MNKEMYDLANWLIKTAKSAGADDCRVGIRRTRFVEIDYRQRKPENIKEASSKRLAIEVFANGRYSRQSTSDLRKDALKDFISNAISTTKLLAEDPYRTLPDPKYYKGRIDMDLGILDPSYDELTPEGRHKIVSTIEESCLSKGGDKVISVTAREYDEREESIMMTSNGFEGYRESTIFAAGAQMTVQDEGDRRPMGFNFVVSVGRKDMPSPEKIGAEAAERTLDLLGAKKIKTETLPIILENGNVERVLGGFLDAMYGRNIQQKQSFLADKKGQRIGSKHFTLIDDPFIRGGLGS